MRRPSSRRRRPSRRSKRLRSVTGGSLQEYASVVAVESTSKLDDEMWIAYRILYSFLTLMEMVLQPALEWIPIWYGVKLDFLAWLVLPQFRGASFIYEKLVREKVIKKYGAYFLKSHNGKDKNKFVDTKKGEKIGMEYVDMCLVHWPVKLKPWTCSAVPNEQDFDKLDVVGTWDGMEKCLQMGLCRAIGVTESYSILCPIFVLYV
ncbi:hypothetical protein OROMI_017125 [Orobanche minor]